MCHLLLKIFTCSSKAICFLDSISHHPLGSSWETQQPGCLFQPIRASPGAGIKARGLQHEKEPSRCIPSPGGTEQNGEKLGKEKDLASKAQLLGPSGSQVLFGKQYWNITALLGEYWCFTLDVLVTPMLRAQGLTQGHQDRQWLIVV